MRSSGDRQCTSDFVNKSIQIQYTKQLTSGQLSLPTVRTQPASPHKLIIATL